MKGKSTSTEVLLVAPLLALQGLTVETIDPFAQIPLENR